MNYDVIKKRVSDNHGYAEAPEIITPEIVDVLKCVDKIIINNSLLKQERQEGIENADGLYNLQMSEMLLLYFTKHMSNIFEKKLIPTYSYTRIYYKGQNLFKHTDRPSCQYSMTLNIGSSSEEAWPFFCRSKLIENAKETKIHNEMFTPIVYMGEKVTHWREALKKNFSTHVFLHYVDREDPAYKKYWYDGRKYIGSDIKKVVS